MSTPLFMTTERLGRSERGASLVEYALLIALIALVLASAVGFFGKSIDSGLSRSDSLITAAS